MTLPIFPELSNGIFLCRHPNTAGQHPVRALKHPKQKELESNDSSSFVPFSGIFRWKTFQNALNLPAVNKDAYFAEQCN